MKKNTNVSTRERVERVRSLDLGPIKFKLVRGTEGQKVDLHEVELMEVEYKRFLTLFLKYPGQRLVPNKKVDAFWHAHILDTLKYAEDCDHVLGHFLHHFPYFGLRGESDAKQLSVAFHETKHFYRLEFGQDMADSAEECKVSDCDAEQCSPAECHNFRGDQHERPSLVSAT